MLPRKTGKPIAFKCTEELRQQTEAIADSLGESLSDYVRRAVEQRNTQKPREKRIINGVEFELFEPETKQDSTHNTVTKPRETMEYKGKTFELFEPPKPTIPELKEKVKQMENKQVQTFMKGGK
jgi:hypothetical protein